MGCIALGINPREQNPRNKLKEHEKKEKNAEIEDRLKRKSYLVIFRIPEIDNQAEEGGKGGPKVNSKEEDKKAVETILNEVGTKSAPTDVRRLGKYNKGSPNPRPVRLFFFSSA